MIFVLFYSNVLPFVKVDSTFKKVLKLQGKLLSSLDFSRKSSTLTSNVNFFLIDKWNQIFSHIKHVNFNWILG